MSPTSVSRLQDQALKGVTHEVMNVSPEMAKKFLGANSRNRNIRSAMVDRYARDMVSGRWEFNGESIKVATDGQVIDGQHRLNAIVRSGVTVPLLIIRGLPAKAQETIDTGAKRSLADSLHMRGESYPTSLGAITRRAILWDAGAKTNVGSVKQSDGRRFTPSESECRDYLTSHPLLRQAAEIATRSSKYVNLPASALGLAFYVCARIDVMDAKTFFIDQLTEGIGLRQGDPALTLSKKLKREAQRQGRAAETDLLAYTLRAWNAYRAKESLGRLTAPPGGWTAASMPVPR